MPSSPTEPDFVVGDPHGCMATFEALLERLRFDPDRHHLWITGDLVNRGPASLEVVRWAMKNERSVTTVLGNHEIHLLARAHGLRGAKKLDTLEPLLDAPDREELLEWLHHRPLMVDTGRSAMVHAGIHPSWDRDVARAAAEEVAEQLRGPRARKLLRHFSERPRHEWHADDAVSALRAFVVLRRCRPDGVLVKSASPLPKRDTDGARPWYKLWRPFPDTTTYHGHWSDLGYHHTKGALGLDTACVWGGTLTGVRVKKGVAGEPIAEPLQDVFEPLPSRRG